MTTVEERVLFERFARGHAPAAQAELIHRFMPLARKLAGRYRNVEDIDELEQVAAIGLMKAVDRFDPERGIAFSTFAFPTILGELKRHLRDRTWSVRVPRGLQELAVRIERVSSELAGELARAPTVAEIAERSGTVQEAVLEALQTVTARRAISLDQSRDADDPDHAGLDVAVEDTAFAAAEDTVVLDELMTILSEREREIMRLRFIEDLTQLEIAERMGLSQMHISRMIRSVIVRLQAAAEVESP
jgi:RNA polymerase sigma-B factor